MQIVCNGHKSDLHNSFTVNVRAKL